MMDLGYCPQRQEGRTLASVCDLPEIATDAIPQEPLNDAFGIFRR
jgi:hypothetical protein